MMPIIMLFFTGMAEIARVLMLQHTADTAAYEGARFAMVPGATAEEGVTAAKQLLGAADIKDAIVSISPAQITETTPLISVEVKIPLTANSWVPNFNYTKMDVVSEVTLFCERPPMVRLTGIPELKAKAAKLKALKKDASR